MAGMSTRGPVLVALLACILTACSPGTVLGTPPANPTPAHTSSASPASSPSTSPGTALPQLACSGTVPLATSRLLIAQPAVDQPGFVIEDLADLTHPVVVCRLPDATSAVFASPKEISYAYAVSPRQPGEPAMAIARTNLLDLTSEVVVTVQGNILNFAWSPDGSTLAYIEDTGLPAGGAGGSHRLWLKQGDGAPRALTPLRPVFGRDGSIADQVGVMFSPDGNYLAMVDTYASVPGNTDNELAYFQVRAALTDWSLALVPGGGVAGAGKGYPTITMATWSSQVSTLYWHDAEGIESWDPHAGSGIFIKGLTWYRPSVSPNGRLIAYTALDAQSKPHIEVRDLAAGTVRILPGTMRADPMFWSDTVLLQRGSSANVGAPGPPYFSSGRVYAVDLSTNRESLMPFAAPLDRWPRPTYSNLLG